MDILVDKMTCICPYLCRNGNCTCCSEKLKENKTGIYCLECPDLQWKNESTIEL